MKKMIYIASLTLSSIVLLFLMMKFFGFAIVVNRTIIDKWMALIALFSLPTSIHMLINKENLNMLNVRTILVAIIVLMWCNWSFRVQPIYTAYVESNNILAKPYLISEKKNSKTPLIEDVIYTKYTIYKSITPVLFKKDSKVVEERGIIMFKENIVKTVEIDGKIYIKTDNSRLLPIK
ncbi:hypothetical protein M3152_00135 [Sporosarcina luteola]|uniref:hypothetical protein n=1 Tax=Bacillales TaxID=1385 RepID=UPI00203D7FB9|nr:MULTISPECIES: hypothetical protein [Bacillales]MCM3636107.1 hypothetical protein [Sporosarcina luteola]